MRAICETCDTVQPPDWQPGDLCVSCGQVVRREKRCHWCVRLTPAGKYCRHCGAGLVPDADYGAARWLKHVGTDQFTIPLRLREMDAEQVAHFTQLYQRHANVAERHLDDLAYAESFARQRGWVQALEDELLPRLPLPDEELKQLSRPPLRGTTEAEKLLEIRDSTPFAPTRLLCALARLRYWQAGHATYAELRLGEDLELALPFLRSPGLALRLEVALTLSHWRFALGMAVFQQREVEAALYQATNCRVEAATHLALLKGPEQGAAYPVPAEALASADADLAFTAALASRTPELLLAALRVPLRRFAAALTLTKMRVGFALAPLLPQFSEYETDDVLRTLAWQQQPRPDLRAYLLQALAGQPLLSPPSRQYARDLLVLDLHPGDAVRLVREQPDGSFITKVLRALTQEPAEQLAVCQELVARDLFYPPQLSVLTDLIRQDTFPVSFVTANFRQAPDTSRWGLQQVIRHQFDTLSGPALHALHAFLRAVKWDVDAPAKLREAADSLLQAFYGGSYPSRPRLDFTEASATLYYGSFKAFIEDFLYGLERLDVLLALQTGLRFLHPLESVPAELDASLLDALTALPPALLQRLWQALAALLRQPSIPRSIQAASLRLLGNLHAYPNWREAVGQELRSLLGYTNHDDQLRELLAK